MEKQENEIKTTETKKKWFAGYIVAGLIWTFAQGFKKNTIDELIILVVAILAGVFYYHLKQKIKVKNETAKIAITFIILYFVSALLIGFLTSIANNWEAVAMRTPLGTEVATRDRDSLTRLNQNQKIFLANFQVRWDEAQKDIDDKANSKIGYMNNVDAYKTLQKLNAERQNQFVQYFNQVSPILAKYSQNLVDAFSQLVKTDEKAKNVYNEIFTAKMNYYQTIIDNHPKTEIEAKASITNNAIDKVSSVEQEGTQAQQNYQKVYNEFFGN